MSTPGPSGGDDTPVLNAFYASTADKTTIIHPSDVEYRLDGTLVFPNRNLTLVGSGTLFAGHGDGTHDPLSPPTRPGRNRSQFRVNGGNMRLEGIGIKGANPNAGLADDAYVKALEAQHCVELAGVSSFTLESCPLSDPYGDMVFLASSPMNQCVRLLNSGMIRSGRMAVTINGVKALLIDNCPMSLIRRSVFDHEPTTAKTLVDGVTIRNSHFGAHREGFLAAVGGAEFAVQCDNWSFENCTADSAFNLVFGIPGRRRKNFSMSKCVSTSKPYGTASGAAIDLRYVDGVRLDVVQPLGAGRVPAMKLAKYTSCTNITEGAST